MLQFKSNNSEDRLIGYKQVSLNDQPGYCLLIHTVLFVYCIEPSTKEVNFILDKSVYNSVSPGKNNAPMIHLKFRDFKDVASAHTERGEAGNRDLQHLRRLPRLLQRPDG